MKNWWRVLRMAFRYIKPALQTPANDKANRVALACYGGCVVMVFLVITMQLVLPGAWSVFWIGFNVPLLCLYTTWFVWSVEGYFYRRDMRKFDEIVSNS